MVDAWFREQIAPIVNRGMAHLPGHGQPQHLRRIRSALALKAAVDAYLEEMVTEGHRAGLSWGEIGAELGVTKQAAHKRFGSPHRRRAGGR